MPRILIVDDDPAIREVVRFALSRAGFGTAEAPMAPPVWPPPWRRRPT